jgi:preprotein translocase subunit SecA
MPALAQFIPGLSFSAPRGIPGKWRSWLKRIDREEQILDALTHDEIRTQSLSLRYRAKSGEPLDALLVPAFALARTAAQKMLGMRHHDVQILGGICLHAGGIAEMQTGEGKTLTAALPLYLGALTGRGVHLSTANDYLARRDATQLEPLFDLLGVTIGVVETNSSTNERREAYSKDITYGSAKEFGFDFLRDRIREREAESPELLNFTNPSSWNSCAGEKPVQRELYYALVDEADSIFIDEARTPLVVSSLPSASEHQAAALHSWAAKHAPSLELTKDFRFDPKTRRVTLEAAGRRRVRELPVESELADADLAAMYEHIERAVQVAREYHRDRQYVVHNGEIVIIDENTGRMAEGRRWRDGIHQAIEAKEGVKISFAAGDAGRITMQRYFSLYERRCGMTGTVANSAPELKKLYHTPVHIIPTNRPPRRVRLPDRVLGAETAKWRAIVQEIEELRATGRPILIGTRSIDRSQTLSELLISKKISHEVLSAKYLEREAEIVALAGQRGAVTVATNMAGRGTDIRLGEGVEALGGLHVIISELHESARIDRQLIGRCGRQGDPGSYRIYMSLEDDILRAAWGADIAKKWAAQGANTKGELPSHAPLFYKAQRKIERDHFRQRKALMLAEKERTQAQTEMGLDPYLDSTG